MKKRGRLSPAPQSVSLWFPGAGGGSRIRGEILWDHKVLTQPASRGSTQIRSVGSAIPNNLVLVVLRFRPTPYLSPDN